ncbi:MAG: DUF4337 domain-containing protein [Betaproteobacteria bacterium]
MSGGKFHVHGPHDHALEHEASHGADANKGGHSFVQWVAIFTAILATIGAIVSYQGGHTQNEALLHKNEAVLKKTEAANQWALYQAKGTKLNLAELASVLATDPEKKTKYLEAAARYKGEQESIMAQARAFEAKSDEANQKSEHALNPHNKLAMAMTLIQIAISLAAICVLTRRTWMLGLAGVAAVGGIAFWVMAFTVTGA